MRLRLALPLLAATTAAAPLSAQTATPAEARAWVAEAERIQDTARDERLAALLDRALPALTAPADAPVRARALALRCWLHIGAVEPDSLVALAGAGMAEAARAGEARAAADLRVCRGYGHEAADRTAEALADYDAGVDAGRRLRDDRVLAGALMLRGGVRYYAGAINGALADLNEAYRIYERLGNRARVRYTLGVIANVYADSRVAQYDRALEYYRQIRDENLAAGNRGELGTNFYNVAATLEQMGRLEEALVEYRRALAAEERNDDADEVAAVRRSIGVVLQKLERPGEALHWLDPALAHYRAVRAAEGTAQVRLSRGVALRKLGRTGEALADLDAARAHFTATDNTRWLEKVEEERALALAAAGDFAGAFEARTAQLAHRTALETLRREEATARMRVEFDTEKKERENAALVRENALRGQALRDAARIRTLQWAVLGLAGAVMAVLAALVLRHLAAARRMRDLAMTDELTRLPNRRHLLRLADAQVAAARRAGGRFAVLALDVDRFKAINDALGHEAGDRVLQRVAHACRAALRQGDALGRTGGEEFVAVLPEAGAEAAVEVAERLRAAVERVSWDDLSPALRVTVSVGVAVGSTDDADFAAVLRRADDSLYRAKSAGRNRTELAAAV